LFLLSLIQAPCLILPGRSPGESGTLIDVIDIKIFGMGCSVGAEGQQPPELPAKIQILIDRQRKGDNVPQALCWL
jgi:hypothetical protein